MIKLKPSELKMQVVWYHPIKGVFFLALFVSVFFQDADTVIVIFFLRNVVPTC